MALIIKKTVIDENGDPIYIEGTEEEVAVFEKKLKKGKEKKEGTKSEKKVLLDDIRRIVQEEIQKVPAPIVINQPAPVITTTPWWENRPTYPPYYHDPFDWRHKTWCVSSSNEVTMDAIAAQHALLGDKKS